MHISDNSLIAVYNRTGSFKLVVIGSTQICPSIIGTCTLTTNSFVRPIQKAGRQKEISHVPLRDCLPVIRCINSSVERFFLLTDAVAVVSSTHCCTSHLFSLRHFFMVFNHSKLGGDDMGTWYILSSQPQYFFYLFQRVIMGIVPRTFVDVLEVLPVFLS